VDTIPPPAAKAKDFLSILDLDHAGLGRLLTLARQMKADRRLGPAAPTAAALAGKHVALLFEKPSLRTRSTFEIAVRELGAHTLHLPAEFAEGVREPLEDIARNLERWVHALVLRTFGQEKALKMASAGKCLSVVNALTDEEHPCQALADVMTIRERLGRLEGVRVAYLGDGNNVCASLMVACAKLGAAFVAATPEGYEPAHEAVEIARKAGGQVDLTNDPREAAEGADALYTDVWTSMGQDDERERRLRDLAGFGIDETLVKLANDDAIVLHCLPAHYGEEIAEDVLYGPQSAVWDEAENRLHAQKALLALVIS